MKTNFEKGDAMLFTMGDADGRKGEQPVIGFEGFTKIDPDAFFAADASKRGPEQDERAASKAFLIDALADGPKAAESLKEDAKASGVSVSSLNRARHDLGVVTARRGTKWYWSLPAD